MLSNKLRRAIPGSNTGPLRKIDLKDNMESHPMNEVASENTLAKSPTDDTEPVHSVGSQWRSGLWHCDLPVWKTRRNKRGARSGWSILYVARGVLAPGGGALTEPSSGTAHWQGL